MRLGLDLDYRQTNERKPFSIQIASCPVYLEPGALHVISISISGERRWDLLTLINVRDTQSFEFEDNG